MDCLQFISDMVSSLAWPSVVLILVLLFRKELIKLLEKLDRFKFKDIELEFNLLKQNAEKQDVDKLADKSLPSPIAISLGEQILDTVEISPASSILLAWSGVETAIAKVASKMAGISKVTDDKPVIRNIEILAKNKLIFDGQIGVIKQMHLLRNRIVHDSDYYKFITQGQASGYANVAINFISYFESIE